MQKPLNRRHLGRCELARPLAETLHSDCGHKSPSLWLHLRPDTQSQSLIRWQEHIRHPNVDVISGKMNVLGPVPTCNVCGNMTWRKRRSRCAWRMGLVSLSDSSPCPDGSGCLQKGGAANSRGETFFWGGIKFRVPVWFLSILKQCSFPLAVPFLTISGFNYLEKRFMLLWFFAHDSPAVSCFF